MVPARVVVHPLICELLRNEHSDVVGEVGGVLAAVFDVGHGLLLDGVNSVVLEQVESVLLGQAGSPALLVLELVAEQVRTAMLLFVDPDVVLANDAAHFLQLASCVRRVVVSEAC